jgi:signal transduction histidine kinase
MDRRGWLEIRDRSWTFDTVLFVVVAVVCVAPLAAIGAAPTVTALSLLMVVALLIRRFLPAVALTAMFIGALGLVVVGSRPVLAIVTVPIMIYTLARYASVPLARVGLAAGLFGSLVGPARWTLDYGFRQSNIIPFVVTASACAGIVIAAYLLGRRRREGVENTEARVQSAEERERLLHLDQEQRARMATVAERNRIARELHDIVAHSLSVIVVQAEGGRALAVKQPDRAPEVLRTIAETSREALEEMRRMVGLLRGDPGEQESTSFRPAPGLDEIGDLVRKTSETAELAVFGTPPPVSAALGLTVYRLVQESLTNVLKHAGPAAVARVTLAYTADSVELEVTDNGRGAAATPDGSAPGPGGPPPDSPGHGLQGMYERVALHGGELTAQPRPGGGFVVRASLPLGQDRTMPLGAQATSP